MRKPSPGSPSASAASSNAGCHDRSAEASAGALAQTVATTHDVDRLEAKIASLEHNLIGVVFGIAAVAATFWSH